MRINQSGFTSAALGFVVFGLLMLVIVFSTGGSSDVPSNSLNNPTLSQESSAVALASSTSLPAAQSSAQVSSPLPSTTPNAAGPNQPAATAQASSAPTSVPATSSPTAEGRYIKIVSPNGGETYKVGATLTITWEYNDLAQCVIKYVTEDGAESSFFVPATPSQKSKQIPILESYLGPLDSVKLKISMDCYSADNNYAGDRSDGFFTVTK